MPRHCIVDGCHKPHIARGYCENHYRVFMRRGNPIPPPLERKTHVATGGYLFQTIKRKTVYVHVLVAERALGKRLPDEAEIHHVDGNPANNATNNIVICQNHDYHMLLHQRERALKNCANAAWRPCTICGQYDDTAMMRPQGRQFYHRECSRQQSKNRRNNHD